MKGEHITFPGDRKDKGAQACTGSAGLKTQIPGSATTVSALAQATGGIGPKGMVIRDTK